MWSLVELCDHAIFLNYLAHKRIHQIINVFDRTIVCKQQYSPYMAVAMDMQR